MFVSQTQVNANNVNNNNNINRTTPFANAVSSIVTHAITNKEAMNNDITSLTQCEQNKSVMLQSNQHNNITTHVMHDVVNRSFTSHTNTDKNDDDYDDDEMYFDEMYFDIQHDMMDMPDEPL